MKKLTLSAVLLAFCFATGFTCSKNAPVQTVETQTTTTTNEPVDQSQMAAPAQPAATEAAPVNQAPTEPVTNENK